MGNSTVEAETMEINGLQDYTQSQMNLESRLLTICLNNLVELCMRKHFYKHYHLSMFKTAGQVEGLLSSKTLKNYQLQD